MFNIRPYKPMAAFIFLASLLLLSNFANAQISQSEDAIAIRVIPNPDHLSARLWYERRGWEGSPQSLTVDGYRAIRDGRTVYVNVANIVGSDLYTNIYLISYNQEAKDATTDIFSQILKHWKFNANKSSSGICAKNAAKNCFIDSDCPVGDYCRSDKAEIIRDVRRLEDLASMRISLEEYRQENGHYPIISAGSYLQHKTLSTWPSWDKVLSQELKESLPRDPVNELGACSGYNETTCWNENNQQFADPEPGNGQLDLPSGSQTYVYIASEDGMSYQLSSVTESGFVQDTFAGSLIDEGESPLTDIPPEILGISQGGQCTNSEFEGFVEAVDPKGGPLTWDIDTSMTVWNMWSAAPVISDTSVEYQKKLWAGNSGQVGEYELRVTVSDEYGQTDSKILNIVLVDCQPPVFEKLTDVQAGEVRYDRTMGLVAPVSIVTVIDTPFELLLEGFEPDAQYPLVFTIPGGMLPNGLELVANSDTSAKLVVAPSFSGIRDYTDSLGYEVEVNITDSYGGQSDPYIFRIIVENYPPEFDPIAEEYKTATGCIDYFADVDAVDPHGHDLNYSSVEMISGLFVTDSIEGYITGQPYTTASLDSVLHGYYDIKVRATDVFFSLTHNPYQALSDYTYELAVQKELFEVSAPNDASPLIYAYPDHPTVDSVNDLYYKSVTYVGSVDTDSPNDMSWYLDSSPSMPASWHDNISSPNGTINITALGDNEAGSWSFWAEAKNPCGVRRSGPSGTLTVKKNEWCGDNIIQAAHGEQCDDGNLNENDLCKPDCKGSECGDGILLSEGCGASCEECDDGNGIYEDRCDTFNDNGFGECKLTFCGDYVTQDPNGRGEKGVDGKGSEDCDNGPSGNETCSDECTLTYCGDGEIQTHNGQGQFENCESDSDCSGAATCKDCKCDCDSCIFDGSTFDNCCFSD